MFDRILVPLIATLMAAGLIGGMLLNDKSSTVQISPPPWTQATASNPTGSYRFTVNGWEDSSSWRLRGDEAKVKFIDNIHPLVWMLFVVLVALGLAILVSDEDSLKRLRPKVP